MSLEDQISDLTSKLDTILSNQKEDSDRLKTFEYRWGSLGALLKEKKVLSEQDLLKIGADKKGTEPAGAISVETDLTLKKPGEVHQDFEAIRDSLIRVRLPNDFRLNESKAGIPQKEREHAAVIAKGACFIETNLKILGEIQNNIGEPDTVAELLDHLLTCNSAAIKYFREEYQGLYVGGKWGGETKQVFKSLRRGTSNLTPDAIEDYKTAIAVTHPQSKPQPPDSARGNFRGFRGFRGQRARGRGWSTTAGYQQKSIPFHKSEQSAPSVIED